MAKTGIGRAVFRTGAFVVVVSAPVGVFASMPPVVPDVTGATEAARAGDECEAAAAPFARLFPAVDRATRARAERACGALGHSIDPVVVREADRDARALLRVENELAEHMLGVLAICWLAAVLAVAGVGVGGALYGVAAGVVACWGGVHVWPLLVAVGMTLLALACAPWPGTPEEERVPAPGAAAVMTGIVGVVWALPALAVIGGAMLRHAAHAPGAPAVALTPALEILLSEIVGGAAIVLVVVPAVVHFVRARRAKDVGKGAKLGLTIAVVVGVLAAALVGYALSRLR